MLLSKLTLSFVLPLVLVSSGQGSITPQTLNKEKVVSNNTNINPKSEFQIEVDQFKNIYPSNWQMTYDVGRKCVGSLDGYYSLSPGVSDKVQARDLAASFLNAAKKILNIDPAQLDSVNVDYDSFLGRYKIQYRQYYNGVRVEGTLLNIMINEKGFLYAVRNGIYPGIKLPLAPAINSASAISIARQSEPKISLAELPFVELIILPIATDNSIAYYLGWKLRFDEYTIIVNGHDGAILRKYNNYRDDYTYTGKITGAIYPITDTTRNIEVDSLQFICIWLDTTQRDLTTKDGLTNANGHYSISHPQADSFYTKLLSPYVVVIDSQANPPDTSGYIFRYEYPATEIIIHDHLFDETDGSPANVYYNIIRGSNAFRNLYGDSHRVRFIRAMVNDNTLPDGTFGRSNGYRVRYPQNMGKYSWSILHEFTHCWVFLKNDDSFIDTSSDTDNDSFRCMDDAYAVYFPCQFNGNSIYIHPNICHDLSTNTGDMKVKDWDSQNGKTEDDHSHYKNRWAMAATWWQLKDSVGSALLDTWIWEALDKIQQPADRKRRTPRDFFNEILKYDDSPARSGDNNPLNGTPHLTQIKAAYHDHGMDYVPTAKVKKRPRLIASECDTFFLGDTVFCQGFDFPSNKEVHLYVVRDIESFSLDSIQIDDVTGEIETITTDDSGTFPLTAVWTPALDTGAFDLVVDVDKDGYFDYDFNGIIDACDSTEGPGFIVLSPEIMCGASVVGFNSTPSHVPPGTIVPIEVAVRNNSINQSYINAVVSISTDPLGIVYSSRINYVLIESLQTSIITGFEPFATSGCQEDYEITAHVEVASCIDYDTTNNSGQFLLRSGYGYIYSYLTSPISYYEPDRLHLGQKYGKPVQGRIDYFLANLIHLSSPPAEFSWSIYDYDPNGDTGTVCIAGPFAVFDQWPDYTRIDLEASLYMALPDSFILMIFNRNGHHCCIGPCFSLNGIQDSYIGTSSPSDSFQIEQWFRGRDVYGLPVTYDISAHIDDRPIDYVDAEAISIVSPGAFILNRAATNVMAKFCNNGIVDIWSGIGHCIISSSHGTEYDITLNNIWLPVGDTIEINFGQWTPSFDTTDYTIDMRMFCAGESDTCNNTVTRTTYTIKGQLTTQICGNAGFTSVSVPDSVWQFGFDTVTGPPPSAEPCWWGTIINGDYMENVCASLITPSFTVPPIHGGIILVEFWYENERDWDYSNVKITTDGGINYSLLTPLGGYPSIDTNVGNLCGNVNLQPGYTGKSNGWITAAFDLKPFAGQYVQLCFDFASDAYTNMHGTYVGCMQLVDLTPPLNCQYMQGDINGDGLRGGGDVTYGVRFFKLIGNRPPDSCYMDSTSSYLYVAGDVNGNCEFRGSDISRLVAYFKLIAQLQYCHFFPPPPAKAFDESAPIIPLMITNPDFQQPIQIESGKDVKQPPAPMNEDSKGVKKSPLRKR